VVGEYIGFGHRVKLYRQLQSSSLFSVSELVDYSNVEVFATPYLSVLKVFLLCMLEEFNKL